MQPAHIKTLFLDIGGVLLTNGWGHASRQGAAETFEFDYAEMNAIHEFIFNVYEIGKITLDEYLNTTLFYQPRAFTKEDFPLPLSPIMARCCPGRNSKEMLSKTVFPYCCALMFFNMIEAEGINSMFAQTVQYLFLYLINNQYHHTHLINRSFYSC